jgi:hypothetical protein
VRHGSQFLGAESGAPRNTRRKRRRATSILSLSSIPCQLPPSPMVIFSVGIECSFDVPVKRPHDANPGEHRWAAKFNDQEQRFHRGLPWRGVVFGLGQLGDVAPGVFEGEELPSARLRDRIVERAFPTPAANGATPSCRIGSGSLRATAALRPFQARCTAGQGSAESSSSFTLRFQRSQKATTFPRGGELLH